MLASPAYRQLRELLVSARTASGLTQSQLASQLGRPQSFVSKYERGERRLDVVEFFEIASALSLDGLALLQEWMNGRGEQ